MLIIRTINCINTTSGMCHSETVEWSKITKLFLKMIGVSFCFVILDHSTVFSVKYTRSRIGTTDSSDNEHLVARNM